MDRTTFFVLMTIAVLPMAWFGLVWYPRRAVARGADPADLKAWRRWYLPLYAVCLVLAIGAAILSAAGKL